MKYEIRYEIDGKQRKAQFENSLDSKIFADAINKFEERITATYHEVEE